MTFGTDFIKLPLAADDAQNIIANSTFYLIIGMILFIGLLLTMNALIERLQKRVQLQTGTGKPRLLKLIYPLLSITSLLATVIALGTISQPEPSKQTILVLIVIALVTSLILAIYLTISFSKGLLTIKQTPNIPDDIKRLFYIYYHLGIMHAILATLLITILPCWLMLAFYSTYL